MVFKADRDIWLLGRKAAEMGLDDLFLSIDCGERLMAEFEASDAGRKWLEGYKQLLRVAQISGAWSEDPQSLHRLPAQRHSPRGVFGQTINGLPADQEISRKIRHRPEVANRRMAQDVIGGRLFILQSRTARAYEV